MNIFKHKTIFYSLFLIALMVNSHFSSCMETPVTSLFTELLCNETLEGSPLELDATFNEFLESLETQDQQRDFTLVDESPQNNSPFITNLQPMVTVDERWRCPCEEINTWSFITLYGHIKNMHIKSDIETKYQCPMEQCTATAKLPARIIYHLRDHHNAFKICCQKLFLNQEKFKDHKKNCKKREPKPRNLGQKDNSIVYE